MSLRLGIDTGGTFTDAVLVDDSKQIVNAEKSLTTRFDLSLGIDDVIAKLPAAALAEVTMVSLSTTLTTNSVVEDLGAPVCVLLPGYTAEQVKQSGLLEKPGITLPNVMYDKTRVKHFHIYNQFILRVPRRDQLMLFLKERGIETIIYYPVPFHLQECFGYLGYKEGDFPVAERAARGIFSLPMYPSLTNTEQEIVAQALIEILSDINKNG